jgi:hypothetical protein
MPLTYEQRLELLVKAREAKKTKRNAKLLPEELPEPPVPEPEPEPEPEPVKITKPKAIKIKKPEPPKYIKDDAKLVKEEYLINDPEPECNCEPEPVVIAPKPVKVSKPRKVKEPVNTLDLFVEPKPIETVMEEVVNNDNKYKNPNLQSKIAKAPPKQHEVVITKTIKPIHFLFDY